MFYPKAMNLRPSNGESCRHPSVNTLLRILTLEHVMTEREAELLIRARTCVGCREVVDQIENNLKRGCGA